MSPRGRPDDGGERAERILDAAAELLLRFGYDRTTVEDVARAACVSKTTVHQRFGGREPLFLAVLRRERGALRRRVRDEIHGTAGPVDLRHVVAAQVRGHQHHPLLAASLLRDAAVLGRLRTSAGAAEVPRGSTVELVAALHERGWIRSDRSPVDLVTVYAALFHGYFATAPLMPDALRVPAAEAPALIADAAHRAFARDEPLRPDEVAAVDALIRDHVDVAVHAGEAGGGGDAP